MSYIDELCERRKNLLPIKNQIVNSYEEIYMCFKNGNKLLICGNGGSSADSSHIMGELVKSFKKDRRIDMDMELKIKKEIEKLNSKNPKFNIEEMYEGFIKNLERGVSCVDLTAFTALNTAYMNDKSFEYVYANAVMNIGSEEDVLLCITTSGNSKNVFNAAVLAKSKNMKVVAMTGNDGGNIKDVADISIRVPFNETYLIQEEHIAIYHAICLDIENNLF